MQVTVVLLEMSLLNQEVHQTGKTLCSWLPYFLKFSQLLIFYSVSGKLSKIMMAHAKPQKNSYCKKALRPQRKAFQQRQTDTWKDDG